MRRQLARQYGVVSLPTDSSNKKEVKKIPTSSRKPSSSSKEEAPKKKTTLDYDKIHKVNGGKNGKRRSNN